MRAIKVLEDDVRRLRQASTSTLHPCIQRSMPPLPTPLSNHPGRPKDGIKERNEGLDRRIMADGMAPHATGASDKVTVTREDGGGRSSMRWRVAAGADDMGAVGARHRRAQQYIKGKRNRKMPRVRESKEGLVRKAGVGIRQPPPEAEGATRHTTIKQPGTASGGGVS